MTKTTSAPPRNGIPAQRPASTIPVPSIRDTAIEYYRAGLCVLPTVGCEKRPALPTWKQYVEQRPGEAATAGMFNRAAGICIILHAAWNCDFT